MEQYIEKARALHNNKYDYSLITELPKRDTRVHIICTLHGRFEQSFHKHLCGDGCRKCSNEKVGKKRIENASNKFKTQANLLHNDYYDYSKSDYKSAKEPIIIICLIHGEFEQTPNRHLDGGGCRKCSNE